MTMATHGQIRHLRPADPRHQPGRAMAEAINVMNDQLVSFTSGAVIVQRPQPMRTRQDAYRHAAWIIACAEVLDDDPSQVDAFGDPLSFYVIQDAVRST